MASSLTKLQTVFDKQCNGKFSTKIAKKPTTYFLIYIPNWPKDVHYEFLENHGNLYAECHIEKDQYILSVNAAFQKISRLFQKIDEYKLEYDVSRPKPRYKKNPSLSIQLGSNISDDEAIRVMLEFIEKTEPYITSVLSRQ